MMFNPSAAESLGFGGFGDYIGGGGHFIYVFRIQQSTVQRMMLVVWLDMMLVLILWRSSRSLVLGQIC